MNKLVIKWIVSLMLSATAGVQADKLRGGIVMDFVSIGNPGNEPHAASSEGWGRVDYFYRIGKYEVTEQQWAKFLAAAQLHTSPLNNRDEGFEEPTAWGGPNKPQIQISWYHAAQFCNWLTSGSTREGAYKFHPTSGALVEIDRAGAKAQYGQVYVLPTIDEWYKAAYFKPDGSGYSKFANGTDQPPTPYEDTNYFGALQEDGWYPVWDVGTGIREQNGTYDIMGNLWEWIEEAQDGTFNKSNENMGLLGGSAHWCDAKRIRSGTFFIKNQLADDPESWIGLRVVVLGPHSPEVSMNVSDRIHVEFECLPGIAYTLESSTNMLSWSPVVPGIIGDGTKQRFVFDQIDSSQYFRVQSYEL